MEFSNTLIQWYLNNKRDLPWRKTTDPYLIWLSEIILQQTKVAQGLPYFLKFAEEFPTVFDLANAEEEKVLKLWQGLGYYSRARNLHTTAKYLVQYNDGEFPKSYDSLLKLKGIGTYTAAAIASFAYNEDVSVLDGNVYRVLARYFDIETDISSSVAKKEFTLLANTLLPNGNSALFNQAIMEFGALQCIPKNPDCSVCIFNESCGALKNKKVELLPIKLKKTKVTARFLNYLIFEDEIGNVIVSKRTQKGIWHNLYEFPLIETNSLTTEKEIVTLIKEQAFVSNNVTDIIKINVEPIQHKLSHQLLHICFWKLTIESALENGISKEEAFKKPFPIVIHNFILKNWF